MFIAAINASFKEGGILLNSKNNVSIFMSDQGAVYSLYNLRTESEYPEDLHWTYEKGQENVVPLSSAFDFEFPLRKYKTLKQIWNQKFSIFFFLSQ